MGISVTNALFFLVSLYLGIECDNFICLKRDILVEQNNVL